MYAGWSSARASEGVRAIMKDIRRVVTFTVRLVFGEFFLLIFFNKKAELRP